MMYFIKKKITDSNDLVIHKITSKDKLGIEKKLIEYNKKVKKDNEDLKIEYSVSKISEHKKQFEYNHVYKFRIPYNPKDHGDLKQDKIKYYEEQQRKLEEDKQKVDQIIESLITNGIFDIKEITSLTNNSKPNPKNSSSSVDTNSVISTNTNNSNNNKKEQYLQRKKIKL